MISRLSWFKESLREFTADEMLDGDNLYEAERNNFPTLGCPGTEVRING